MDLTSSKSVKKAGKDVAKKVKQNANSPFVRWLERLGFIIRGVIYFVIGLLALQLAMGAGGAATDPTSAIQVIGHQPGGKILLAVIAVGLVGYSLWGFVRAIFDPLNRGKDASGLVDRTAFLFSGVAYGLLLVPTIEAFFSLPGGFAQGNTNGVWSSLMAGPLGKWVLVAIGIVWVVVGIVMLYIAYTARFLRDLKTNSMKEGEVKTATWLGKIGYTARGIVFSLIGILILKPVFAGGSGQAQGFDSALAALAYTPYGELSLGLVATGLILFGIYSALCSKWTKIRA